MRLSACSKVDYSESPIDGKGQIRDVHLGKTNIGSICSPYASDESLINDRQPKFHSYFRVNTAVTCPGIHQSGQPVLRQGWPDCGAGLKSLVESDLHLQCWS